MDNLNDKVLNDIVKAFLAQTESAIKISKIVADHSEEKILDGDKIICGLVYRLMVPMTNEEIQSSLENAEDLMNSSDSCSEYDSESDDLLEDNKKEHYLQDDDFKDYEEKLKNDEIKPHKIISNNCNCDICMKVRVCLLNYHQYECNDPLAQRFKDAIENTCNEHKVII